MEKILKTIMENKILFISTIISGILIIVSCGILLSSKFSQQNINQIPPIQPELNQNYNPNPTPQPAGTNPNMQQALAENEDEEDTVIVSVTNFGRSNPFKPYRENSLVFGSGLPGEIPSLNIPEPPEFNPDSTAGTLLGIKVSGILYDPVRSSAIVNIKNEDYMVHKGDMIFDFYIQNITPEKVTVRTGNNIYSAGIGEILYGSTNSNPVQYAGRNYVPTPPKTSSLPEIKLIDPVNLPPLR